MRVIKTMWSGGSVLIYKSSKPTSRSPSHLFKIKTKQHLLLLDIDWMLHMLKSCPMFNNLVNQVLQIVEPLSIFLVDPSSITGRQKLNIISHTGKHFEIENSTCPDGGVTLKWSCHSILLRLQSYLLVIQRFSNLFFFLLWAAEHI